MFYDGIKLTIQWYKDYMDWMNKYTSSVHMKYYEEMYINRYEEIDMKKIKVKIN